MKIYCLWVKLRMLGVFVSQLSSVQSVWQWKTFWLSSAPLGLLCRRLVALCNCNTYCTLWVNLQNTHCFYLHCFLYLPYILLFCLSLHMACTYSISILFLFLSRFTQQMRYLNVHLRVWVTSLTPCTMPLFLIPASSPPCFLFFPFTSETASFPYVFLSLLRSSTTASPAFVSSSFSLTRLSLETAV